MKGDDETARRHKVRRLEAGVFGAALLVFALAAHTVSVPSIPTLVVFSLFLFAAENSSVILRSSARMTPGVMVVMAAIAAYHGEGHGGVVLGAAITALIGAIEIDRIREHRIRVQLYNCSMYVMAAVAAAESYELFTTRFGAPPLVAVAIATVAYAAVNMAVIVPAIVIEMGRSAREVVADASLPNYIAFGLLGCLVGQLYTALGPLALVLMITPVAIARLTFASFLELHEAHEATIKVFMRAIHTKDAYTGKHTERVAKYSVYIGEEMGFSHSRLEHLRQAALMHDIGKLAVPKHLLNKPGKLTDAEFEQVQAHAHVCIDILTLVDFLRPMTAAASGHHSRFDGGGYGGTNEHPIEAYIVAVADAYDAMTSTRSYRRALPMDVAFAELRAKSGSQFHPECVEGLIRAITRRGEKHGLGYEDDVTEFAVAPPVVGVGSAGLGDRLPDGKPGDASPAAIPPAATPTPAPLQASRPSSMRAGAEVGSA